MNVPTHPNMTTRISPRRFILLPCFAIFLAASLPSPAQTPPADPYKTAVDIRRNRVDLLRNEVKLTDDRVEARLDDIVQTLVVVSDSKNSRTKVARMKEDTIKRLYGIIRYYDQKRAALKEELRNPRL